MALLIQTRWPYVAQAAAAFTRVSASEGLVVIARPQQARRGSRAASRIRSATGSHRNLHFGRRALLPVTPAGAVCSKFSRTKSTKGHSEPPPVGANGLPRGRRPLANRSFVNPRDTLDVLTVNRRRRSRTSPL